MPKLAGLIDGEAQAPTYTDSVLLAANVAEFLDVPVDENGLYAKHVRFGKGAAADFYAKCYTEADAADRAVNGNMTSYITNGAFGSDASWTKGDGWTIAGGVAVCDGSQTAASLLSQTAAAALLSAHTYTISYTVALSEHATNGAFASDTAWTKGAGWAIAAGVATATASSAALEQDSAITLVEGRTYTVTFTTSSTAGGSVAVSLGGGTAGTSRSTDDTFVEVITAGATQVIAFTGTGFSGSIDDVTITAIGNVTPSIGGTAGEDRATAATFQEAIVAGSTQIIAFTADENFVGTIDNVAAIGWELGTDWTIGSGVATASNTADGDLSQSAYYPLESGETYQVTFTLTASAGSLACSLGGGTAGSARSTSATFTEIITAGATQEILFASTGFTGTVDDVSIIPSAKVGVDASAGESSVQNPTGFFLNGTITRISVASAGTPVISASYYK